VSGKQNEWTVASALRGALCLRRFPLFGAPYCYLDDHSETPNGMLLPERHMHTPIEIKFRSTYRFANLCFAHARTLIMKLNDRV
jgi:hypothetical protein